MSIVNLVSADGVTPLTDANSNLKVTNAASVVLTGPAAQSALNTDLLSGTVNGWYDVSAYRNMTVQIIGSAGISAGAVTFEQSNDGVNAQPLFYLIESNLTVSYGGSTGSVLTVGASTSSLYSLAIKTKFIRIRISTAFVGGTVQAIAALQSTPQTNWTHNLNQVNGANIGTIGNLTTAAAQSDATANPSTGLVGSLGAVFNGTTWDRQRSNMDVALITAVAATATQNSADQLNVNGRGVKVVLDVTAAGTGSITLTVQGKDFSSGKYYTLLTGVAVTTISTNVYEIYPGVTATANVAAATALPRTWRVLVTANNANPTTYTVSGSIIV